MNEAPVASPLTRLWRYASAYRGPLLLATLCSILNKAVDLAPPVLIGAAVDIVVRREGSLLASWGFPSPREQLMVLAVLTFLIWTLESVFEYAYAVLWRNLAQSVQHDLRLEAYSRLQGLELAYLEDRSTGGLMAILNDDVNQLERFLDVGANEVLQVLTTVVLVGAAFFYLAPSVAWMSFVPVPLILWGSLRFQKQIQPRYAEVRERVASLSAQLANNLGGISTIQSFVAEEREVERIREESDAYRRANRKAIQLSSAFSPLIRIAVLIGFTATLLYGGFLALDGGLEVGAYSVLVFLTQRLLWPLTRLGQTFDLYQRAMASTVRVLDLLDTQPQVVSGPERLELADRRPGIRLEDVTFSYQLGYPALDGLDLDIEGGSTTALVGATGSGKTTVLKLLMRFYDVDSGRILLDGRDIRTLRLGDLRTTIAFVSQDVFLFQGTVRENLIYGRPAATADEIVAAARAAEAHDFILELPQGYDTVVGERGQKLSGGQRQRLSIARAVLKEAPILVLDEATSAVDNETEAAIQRSIARISHQRTTLVIAHRLSTIRSADRIYVLEGGRLAEEGDHETLLARDGIYASLWRVQTGRVGSLPAEASLD
ncbi:MAG: ABC transporter ATP-binding protein/permease [Thermoanaerobaculia bacterium]|nr:ABC transporter ATP-binding protein/permease [Thermoanaerobaculia bacterium]